MTMPLVETKEVTKIYRNKEGVVVRAVDAVDLRIDRGEFLVIVGRSGAGKTTLLNLIGALNRPSSGGVIFDGKDTSKLSNRELALIRREKIGFIFQDFNLLPTLTVLENIEVALAPTEMLMEEQRKKSKALLTLFDLADKSDCLPSELSLGQQQRVAIARALINNPSLILADEPTGELDPIMGRIVVKNLVELNQKYNTTLVVATHGTFPYNTANRVLFMKDGKIVTCEEAGYKDA